MAPYDVMLPVLACAAGTVIGGLASGAPDAGFLIRELTQLMAASAEETALELAEGGRT